MIANNSPTTAKRRFTDDDLSRWNTWCVIVEEKKLMDRRSRVVDYPEVVAILNRLEAAEKVARLYMDGLGGFILEDAISAWRLFCGRTKG